MSKFDSKLEKTFYLFLKGFYYYHFILAILNLIFFYFKLYNLLNITTVLLLVSIIIEFFNGYIRGYFGIVSYIISVILGIYFINDIWHGISIGISFLSILSIFINGIISKIFSYLIKKFN